MLDKKKPIVTIGSIKKDGAEGGSRTPTPAIGTRSLVLRVYQFHHFCTREKIIFKKSGSGRELLVSLGFFAFSLLLYGFLRLSLLRLNLNFLLHSIRYRATVT